MVATYRSSDANPKERFVHHQAGDGGYGGSSYIDLVAFREKDANTAWTSASDGTLEERLYYCQNQHADVVALITAAGTQREMVRYSAYGVPLGIPVGDVDGDLDCDLADQNQVRDWALAPTYDVRGDLDLDGDTDLDDRNNLRDNFKVVTLGRSILSAPLVSNQRGVAGYVSARHDPTLYLIRHRALPSELGAWAGRDPLGHVDGQNLYEYVTSRPLATTDPSGRATEDGVKEKLIKAINYVQPLSVPEQKLAKNSTTAQLTCVMAAGFAAKYAKQECKGLRFLYLTDCPCDAVYHCVWQCNLTTCAGAEYAKKWGDAHEEGGNDPPPESQKDQCNNEIGRGSSPLCGLCVFRQLNNSLCGCGPPSEARPALPAPPARPGPATPGPGTPGAPGGGTGGQQGSGVGTTYFW